MQIKKIIKIITKPYELKRIFLRTYINWQRSRYWKKFDKTLKSISEIKSYSKGESILIEGFWDNPNQFFRLTLLLEVLTKKEQNVIALLRNKNDRSKNTLIAMGVRDFAYLSDIPITQKDRDCANKLLEGISSYEDLLSIKLPCNMPTHIFYDTALKIDKSAQPSLSSKVWKESLSDVFRLERFYKKLFSTRKIKTFIVSHPWKNEFGMALSFAFKNKINCYFLYAIYEMMRIKRFTNFEDITRSPFESMTYKEFSMLKKETRQSIEIAGKNYIISHSKGVNSDINEAKAYKKKQDGEKFLEEIGISRNKPIITIFCHAWYDFPHTFGMKNFTDFFDWITLTYQVAINNKEVTWIFKPHPTESWYGGFFLKDHIKESPGHIYITNEETSVNTILDITDSIITVHGTIGIEAAARGIPVISADKSYYTNWNFTQKIKSRNDYIHLLKNLGKSKTIVSEKMINKARAFAYLSMAPAEKQIKIKRLIADHTYPKRIFGDLIDILKNEDKNIELQKRLIRKWIKSESPDFCIFHKINFHKLINK